MNLLTWLGGSWASIDCTPGDYPELHEDAACDKHGELVEAVAIEALQDKIKARGGTVTIAQHVARLKERRG